MEACASALQLATLIIQMEGRSLSALSVRISTIYYARHVFIFHVG